MLVDTREWGMRGLHELALEFAFGAWGKGAKRVRLCYSGRCRSRRPRNLRGG
jgi:hypothetical protein